MTKAQKHFNWEEYIQYETTYIYFYSNEVRFIAIKQSQFILGFIEKSREEMFNLYFSRNEF